MRLASSSAEGLYRPEDQAFKAHFPTLGDYNALGSFFDEQFCDVDNEHDSKPAIGNLGEFMTASSTVNEYPLRPSRSESMLPSPSQPQPWRKALWSLSHKPAAQVVVQKTRRRQQQQQQQQPQNQQREPPRPDPLPCDNENPGAWSLQSPRASPKPANTKGAPPPQACRAAMPPSPMYFQLPLHTKIDPSEPWQQDFDDFDLGVSQEQQEQVDSLATHTQSHPMAVPVSAPSAHLDTEIGLAISNYEDLLPDVFGSDGSTAMDPGLIGEAQSFGTSPPLHSAALQPHDFEPLPTPSWPGSSLDSTSNSHPSYENLRPAVRGSQSVQNIHDLYKKHEHSWGSPTQGTIRRRRLPTRIQTHHAPEVVSMPTPNSAHMMMCQNVDQGQNGLYFAGQMEHAAFHEPPTPLHHSLSTGELPYSPHLHAQQVMNPMPVMPLPPHITSANPAPFVSPRKTRVTGSRSPSPPLLPPNTSRMPRQRSPTRGPSEHSLRRRKSIQKLGPIKDLHDPPPLPHASTRTHSRSRSMSKVPKAPKTPTGGTVSMDFVNFTPKDSLKLLSDVAPSGSSKTRARREAEAREKRKKLSEAALRAVSSVGGDVEALKKVIMA